MITCVEEVTLPAREPLMITCVEEVTLPARIKASFVDFDE
jgi:hypothetical protein